MSRKAKAIFEKFSSTFIEVGYVLLESTTPGRVSERVKDLFIDFYAKEFV